MRMNRKGFGRKRSWPNFKVVSRYSPEGTRKPIKTSIRIAGRRGRESNPGSPEGMVMGSAYTAYIFFQVGVPNDLSCQLYSHL
jgi:hypothetical protein